MTIKVTKIKKSVLAITICCLLSTNMAFADNNQYNNVKIYSNLNKVHVTPEYIKQVENLFYQKMQQNSYQETMKLADYLIVLNSKLYGPESIQTANMYITKGQYYSNLKIFNVAKDSIDKAEEIAKLYPDNTNLKNYINNALFSYYCATNQPFDNLKLLKTINPDNLPTERESIEFYDRLGSVYMVKRDYKNAEIYYNLFNKISKEKYGNENLNGLQYYQELLYLANTETDFDKFNEYYPLANEEYNKFFKGNLFQLLRQINIELDYYINTLNYDAAKKVLDDNIQTFNTTNEIESFYNKYAQLYKEVSDYKSFQEYINKLEDCYSKLPANSLTKLQLFEKKIDYYKDTKDLEKANIEADKALKLIEPVKDYVPVIYGKYLSKAGEIKTQLNPSQENFEYLNKSIENYKKSVDENSIELFDAYKLIGEYYQRINEQEKALEYFNKALNITLTLQGKEHLDTADVYGNIAFSYSALNKKYLAIKNIDKSIEIYKNVYGENHLKTYEKVFDKYNIYNGLNQYKKAAKILNQIISAADNNQIIGYKKEFYFNIYTAAAYYYQGLNCIEKTKKYKELATNYISYEDQKNYLKDLN